MSEQRFFFYIPPGAFTSFDLITIHYSPSDQDVGMEVSVVFGDERITFPETEEKGDVRTWPYESFSALGEARASKFEFVVNGGDAIPILLDGLTLVTVEDELDANEIPKDVFIFRFLAGYFAMSKDMLDRSVVLPDIKYLTAKRRGNYKYICDRYIDNISSFEEEFNTRFSSVYTKCQEMEESRRNFCAQAYREYVTRLDREVDLGDSPVEEVREEEEELPKRRSLSARPREISIVQRDRREGTERETTGALFPPSRRAWRSPSAESVKMCLVDMCLLFPLDASARTFCGISEDDQDVRVQRMYLTNTAHFLMVFSEFTGLVYDYRIRLVKGWYQFEDRLTLVEITCENLPKSVQMNPYKDVVMQCLQKIVKEFRVKNEAKDFTGILTSVLEFHATFDV